MFITQGPRATSASLLIAAALLAGGCSARTQQSPGSSEAPLATEAEAASQEACCTLCGQLARRDPSAEDVTQQPCARYSSHPGASEDCAKRWDIAPQIRVGDCL